MVRTMLLGCGLVFSMALPATAADDKEKLVGTWMVTSMEKDGKQQTAEVNKDKTVKITADTITCTGKDGKCDMASRYTLDTSAKPWQATFNCTEGEYKGKTMKGIVKLEGDTLQICFSNPDEAAPTDFKASDAKQCSITLKRVEN